ncbi:MAG: ABC transporter substrate-binding protein [Firmicutes bacterium]|nr:ABC transporter substrate-binding protein [Bacillota bacterium]
MKKPIRFFAVLTAMVLMGSVLTACSSGSPDTTDKSQTTNNAENNSSTGEPVYGGEITVGIAQDLDSSLDPHESVAAGTDEVMFNVFEGLVKPTPEGDIIPAVAESYEVDGATYTFKLREGVKFHNGDTVTVDDIVYSITRCADASEGTPRVPAFSAITSIKALDEETIEIVLNAPNSEFLPYLTVAIIPADYTDQAVAPVGTGPFKYVSRSPQENFIIEKFDEYWGEPAYLDKITFKILDSAEAIVMSLRSGSVDFVSHLTTAQVAELGGSYKILEGTMNLVQAVYLNNAYEPLQNELVRKALCHAVNIEEILLLTADGHGAPLGSSMYPSFKKFFNEDLVDYYEYNPEKAKELLKEAGYENGFDLAITVPSNYTPHVNTAEVVVEQFRAVGINAKVESVEWATWLSDVYQGRNYQSTISGFDASAMTGRAMLERWISTSSKNFIQFYNDEYDTLFTVSITTTDDAKLIEIYDRMQEILTENAACVYLQDLADLVAMNPALDGYEFYPIYVMDLAGVHYVK